MTNVLVGKHGTCQIAHDLMHVDQNPRSVLGIKGDRLDMRVDLTPLLGPVRANFVRSVDKTAFERFRPCHVGSHEGESGTHVARVESCIRCA